MNRILIVLSFLISCFASRAQTITTIAGTGSLSHTGDSGPATDASIGQPYGCAVDNFGNFYFTDDGAGSGCWVRKIDLCGTITTVAGNGACGSSTDGGMATASSLDNPLGIAFDASNNMYIAEEFSGRVRKVDAGTGIITSVAGNGTSGFSGDGGQATAAELNEPANICFDRLGNLYIIDGYNYRIRKVDTSGIITTYAGTGTAEYTGDGGPATNAEIDNLYGICADTNGNIYFEQQIVYVVRKIDTAGIITTIAGDGFPYTTGDGGSATAAGIEPFGLAYDHSGNLFISGFHENNVRKINSSGIISTAAGDSVAGFSGDGGNADSAELYAPYGIAVDQPGNLYIADAGNSRIRKVTFNPVTTPTVSVSITASADTVCVGSSVTFTAVVTGTMAVTCQWLVNGSATTGTGTSFTYTPANGDSVRCVLSAAGLCNTVSSNSIIMRVNPVVVPSVAIIASATTVCVGTTVTYSATATGSSSYAYRWLVNGAIASTAGSTYSYAPANGDSIRCELEATNTCSGAADTVSSNSIHMVVHAVTVPSVTITAAADTVCTGTTVTYSATATGATTYAYRWLVNGSAAGTASTYSYIPANGDSVRCVFTGTGACSTATSVSSNTIDMVVDTPAVPVISIAGIPATTPGTAVPLIAYITGAGSSYHIAWYADGALFATTTMIATTYTPTAAGTDTIIAEIIPNGGSCYDSAASAAYIITVKDESVQSIIAPDISIYPNPVHEDISLTLSEGEGMVVVSDIMGKALITIPINGSHMNIDMGGLPAGVYMLTVTYAGGNKSVHKVVKE